MQVLAHQAWQRPLKPPALQGHLQMALPKPLTSGHTFVQLLELPALTKMTGDEGRVQSLSL